MKVVLAYSGGLDTSILVSWLKEQGYQVIALCLDLGQKVDSLDKIKERGLQAGADKVLIENIQQEFVEEYILSALYYNAVYEGVYLLGTALARPLIAKKQIECAIREKAHAVAHGATGKGNDQVRFEMSYYCLNPNIEIIAPWKDKKFYELYPGRKELIEYAQARNIKITATKDKPWSSDENLMHISFEAGMLEDPWQAPRKDMFELSVAPEDAPDRITEIEIYFEKGVPISINGEKFSLVNIMKQLNTLGGKNAIGRLDIVESRFVGMKSRGVYETPAGTILYIAHRALESITLTKDVIDLKETLMPRFARLVYEGFWFTPQMDLLRSLAEQTQKNVSGTVRLTLYKGNVTITGRKSDSSLYDEDIASMEKDSGHYNPQDATGFIKLNALPYRIKKKLDENSV